MPSRSSGAHDVGTPAQGLLRPRAVLFVDVDGVLNVSSSDHEFSVLHQSLVDRLARVVTRTGARVVLSSSWRHDPQRLTLLRRAWAAARLPALADETPSVSPNQVVRELGGAIARDDSLHACQRVLEIRQWLDSVDDSSVDTASWAAIDDLNLAAAAHSMNLLGGHFIQTDPRRGLQSHHIEELVDRLGEREESRVLEPLSLRSPVRVLSALADLLVVSGSGSDVIVVDVHDFTVIASFDRSRTSFREWLIGQRNDVSTDRIVGIVLTDELAGETNEPGPIPECSVFIRALTPSPSEFAHTLGMPYSDNSRASVLHTLLGAIHNHQGEVWCREAAVAELEQTGFDHRTIEFLARDWTLLYNFLDSLRIMKPMHLTPPRASLLIRVCQAFGSPFDVVVRRAMAEYTARDELRSLATLQAISRMVGSVESNTSQLDLEAIDQLVASI